MPDQSMPDQSMPDAEQLKAYLADRDTPCPGCGYNLRGVAEPVCPECGRVFTSLEEIAAESSGSEGAHPRKWHQPYSNTSMERGPLISLCAFGCGSLFLAVGLIQGFWGLVLGFPEFIADAVAMSAAGLLAMLAALRFKDAPSQPGALVMFWCWSLVCTWLLPALVHQVVLYLMRPIGDSAFGWSLL